MVGGGLSGMTRSGATLPIPGAVSNVGQETPEAREAKAFLQTYKIWEASALGDLSRLTIGAGGRLTPRPLSPQEADDIVRKMTSGRYGSMQQLLAAAQATQGMPTPPSEPPPPSEAPPQEPISSVDQLFRSRGAEFMERANQLRRGQVPQRR
jgi:hypothetical protein